MKKRIVAEQEWLVRIESQLRQTVPVMEIASCQVKIPTNDQVPVYPGPAYARVYEYLRRQRALVQIERSISSMKRDS